MERDKGGGGGTGGGRRYASAIYYHHKRSGHASGGAATSEEGGVTAQRTEENDGNDTSAVRIQGSDGRDGAVGEGNVSGRRARKCGVCGSGSHFTHQCKDRYGPVCRSCGKRGHVEKFCFGLRRQREVERGMFERAKEEVFLLRGAKWWSVGQEYSAGNANDSIIPQEKDEQQQIVAATTVKVKRKRADSVEQIQEIKEEKDVICPNVGKGGVDALSMLSNAYSFEDDDELAIK